MRGSFGEIRRGGKFFMTPPEAIQNLGVCPAKEVDVEIPLSADSTPESDLETIRKTYPTVVVKGVCQRGDDSFLVIDPTSIRVNDLTAPVQSKDDLIWWIVMAEMSLNFERMRIYGALSELARSKEQLETGGESDASIVAATAGAIAASAVGFGLLVPYARDSMVWIRRGLPPDATATYRTQLRTELRTLMVRKNLCGSLPGLVPAGASWLTRLAGERLVKLLAVGLTLGGAYGMEKLMRAAVRAFESDDVTVALPDPGTVASKAVHPGDSQKRLDELKGKSMADLQALRSQLQEQAAGLELLSENAAAAAKKIHEAILRKSLDRLGKVDGPALADKNLENLVHQVQTDVEQELQRIQSERSFLPGLLKSLPERALGTLDVVVGFGIGVTVLEEEWYKPSFFHIRVGERRRLIEGLARERAPGILERLVADGSLSQCGSSGRSDGTEVGASTAAAPAVAAEPAGAPVPAAEAGGARDPVADVPENESRVAVSSRATSRAAVRPVRVADFQFQDGWSYSLEEALPKLPVDVRANIEVFLRLNNVVRDLASIRLGVMVAAEGPGWTYVLYRADTSAPPGPDARLSSPRGGSAASGEPSAGPQFSGPAFLVSFGINVGAMLVIDWSLTKLGIENPAVRIPAQWSAAYGITYGLHRAGLAAKPTLKGFFVRGAFFAAGQIAASLALDRVAGKVGTDWFRSGTFSNSAASITAAYAALTYGERVLLPRVGPHMVRLAASLGMDAAGLAGLGRFARGAAWGTAAVMALNHAMKKLVVDSDYEGSVNQRVTEAVYGGDNVYGLDRWDFLVVPLAVKGLRAGCRWLASDSMEWAVSLDNPERVAQVRLQDAELAGELRKAIRLNVATLFYEAEAEMQPSDEILRDLERPVALTDEEAAVIGEIEKRDAQALARKNQALLTRASRKMRLMTIQTYAKILERIDQPVTHWARSVFNPDGTLKPGQARALIQHVVPDLLREQREAERAFASL